MSFLSAMAAKKANGNAINASIPVSENKKTDTLSAILEKIADSIKAMNSNIMATNNGNRSNEIMNYIIKMNAGFTEVLEKMNKNQVNMIREISELKDCLQQRISGNKPRTETGLSNESNVSRGINDNKEAKQTGQNIQVDRQPIQADIIKSVLAEVKTGKGEELIKMVFKAKGKKFADKDTFEKAFKEVWLPLPEREKYCSNRNLNKLIIALWSAMNATVTEVHDNKPSPTNPGETKQENGIVKDSEYFAKLFGVEKQKVIDLFNMVSLMKPSNLNEIGKFDDTDLDYILTESLGKDISNMPKVSGFCGTLLNIVKSN